MRSCSMDAAPGGGPGGSTPDTNGSLMSTRSRDCESCFRGRGLRQIARELYLPLAGVTHLDLSHNELAALPGIDALRDTLQVLDLSRNWLK
eukprot:SAG22_NODE_14556_length_371_cov_1.147059_2_plen_90_part_01